MVSEGTDPPLLTPALDGSEGSASRPGHFTHKDITPRYPLDKRLGEPQSWYRCCRNRDKYLAPVRNGTLAVQPIAHQYIDYDVLAQASNTKK
jgi:hypothetical protein